MATLAEINTKVRKAGLDPADVDVVFRDGSDRAVAAESAGSPMQVLEVDEILVIPVDGRIILSSFELDDRF